MKLKRLDDGSQRIVLESRASYFPEPRPGVDRGIGFQPVGPVGVPPAGRRQDACEPHRQDACAPRAGAATG